VEVLVVDTTAFINNAALHVSTSRIRLCFNDVFRHGIQNPRGDVLVFTGT
jgi:hypothetical protein